MFAKYKFSTKLQSAFFLCACITLLVGSIGIKGVGRLADALSKTYSEDLIAVSSVGNILSGVTAHNRGVYRLISAKALNAPEADIQRLHSEITNSLDTVERTLSASRDLLQGKDKDVFKNIDERWSSYIATSRKALEHINNGEIEVAQKQLDNGNLQVFRELRQSLREMVAHNDKGIQDGAKRAMELRQTVFSQLIIGIVAAFLFALGTGVIITRMITRPLAEAVASAERIASGDLTHPICTERSDEAGRLLAALSDMQISLKNTLLEIASAADQLATSSEELSAVTDESTRSLIRQNDEIQQAATAVTEMTNAIEHVATNAVSTSDASRHATDEAEDGRNQVERTVDGIHIVLSDIQRSSETVTDLASRVHNISGVLDVIRSISEQTNLLALNAAIEAARAGEQGRGFAVVADEVRALAHRTQASTVEIETMIGAVKTDADSAVAAMGKSLAVATATQNKARQAGTALEQIARNVYQINERNLVIASASEQQAQVAREVDKNLHNIQQLSEQTTAGANQTAGSSRELSHLAASFNMMVSKFKL